MKKGLVCSIWGVAAFAALSSTANAGLARIQRLCPDEIRSDVLYWLNDGVEQYALHTIPDMACGPAIEDVPGLRPNTTVDCELEVTSNSNSATFTCEFNGTEREPIIFRFTRDNNDRWQAADRKPTTP